MAERKYKHLTRGTLGAGELSTYERVNQAYQDKLGTNNMMQSPYTLDVDETKVTARRSAYPSLDTVEYFNGANYNVKRTNMGLSNIVSATMRERIRPDLQPGEIIDPVMGKGMPQYQYDVQDDSHVLLYLGAFVIGIVIFTSLI
jgi:hypothetical protein